MLTIEASLASTSYDLELEKIRNKIKQLYRELVIKTYKAANPGASSEDIETFLEQNELEFKGDGFEEEAEDLEALLDRLTQTEDLDEVKEKSYENYDVQTGSKLKSVSEGRPAPKTTTPEFHRGGLFTPADKKQRPGIKGLAPKMPKETLKRSPTDSPKINTQHLQDIWDKERDKLLALVRERNREYGVRL